MTVHLVCVCGAETWTWSCWTPDPIALDFRQSHERRGHTVKVRPGRRKAVASP